MGYFFNYKRNICVTDIYKGHDNVKRASKGLVNDIQDWKVVESKNYQCLGRCKECEANASGSRYLELKGSDANPLFVDFTANIKGRRTKTSIHASV
jgi:hypothetical protein